MTYANRGQAFENLLDYTNKVYEQRGIALINKRPTPVRVLQTRGNRIMSAVYAHKSTVDYDGVYRGRAITFEAKSTNIETRLPLSMIPDHQIKYLKKAKYHNAISFVIANMRAIDKTYVLPTSLILEYFKKAREGGRKSIPVDDMQERGIEVGSQDGIPLHYLKAINEMEESE